MAEGRSASLWAHTSHVLALVANVNRNPKKPPFKPAQFNPHAPRRRRGDRKPSVEMLTRAILRVAEVKQRGR